jgi:hypothetical protein
MDKCEYCEEGNTEDNSRGSDCVIYKDNKYYLYIEHFRNEKYFIPINYCPECGVKLEGK